MELRVEQPCPTCGAPIVLGEEDRLVTCDYCDVGNYRIKQKLPRYVLPARLPSHIRDEHISYIPYLRFKGGIYYCQGLEVKHRIIDTTRVAVQRNGLPLSLGLRPQAMSVRPATEDVQGKFIRQTVKTKNIFLEAARLTTLYSREKRKRIHHRVFIGESVSRVYLPVYIQGNTLVDAVSNRPLGPAAPFEQSRMQSISFQREWEPRFLSTLCPQCGDAMKGSAGTLVMYCTNCESQWYEQDGVFDRINFSVVPPRSGGAIHLPFWLLEPVASGYPLHTLADFLKLTNQPVVIRDEHRSKKLTFIVPAFKIKPGMFLNTAKNLTLTQTVFTRLSRERIRKIFPVTLDQREAAQALKSITAASALSRKRVMDILPDLTFACAEKQLLYLPFSDAGHDMIEQHSGLSIPAAVLHYGLNL